VTAAPSPHPDATLLGTDEPPAFRVLRADGKSPFFLTCDHASARVPRKLGSLGLSAEDLERHIAWDIGAAGVAVELAARLDSFAILQGYSRLVIDCNRQPGSPQSILRLSEATPIPGNEAVTPEDAAARVREVFRPYHDRIRAELDARAARRQPTVLISVHSFTPRFHGNQRPWHAGVLYNRDARLARPLLQRLRADSGLPDSELTIGDNEPYSVSDSTDYTIPEHGEKRGLPHVGIELRQDLVGTAAGQGEWAERLALALVSVINSGDDWCKFDLGTS
jgi:predicted N-formylglutamate amidohydrolase